MKLKWQKLMGVANERYNKIVLNGAALTGVLLYTENTTKYLIQLIYNLFKIDSNKNINIKME